MSHSAKEAFAILTRLSERVERPVVWSTWGAMVLLAFACFAIFARNIPLAEDWLLVGVLTGNEPDLLRWLWEQNNEHRIPLPKSILLAVLTAAGGDFRAGMIVNIGIIAAMSAAMILVARHLRGGRTRLADAFFPLILLNLGNWENLFWSWQLTQVLPTMLACAILLVFVRFRDLSAPVAVTIAGACLLLLPFCGANGLVFVPIPALWMAYCGFVQVRRARNSGAHSRTGIALIAVAAVAIALCGVYFFGYERPNWLPPGSGVSTSLSVAVQFLSFGLGPGVRHAWGPAAAGAVGILLIGTTIALRGVRDSRGHESQRALGLLLFLANLGGFMLAMGWSRASALDVYGFWPLRYSLMAAPAFCAVYLISELYGSPRLRAAVQIALFAVSVLLAPLNIREGGVWAQWYHDGTTAVEQDLADGVSPHAIAQRHGEFLIHWWDADRLVNAMHMLHDDGVGPFAGLHVAESAPAEGRSDESVPPIQVREVVPDGLLVAQTFAYRAPGAGEVWLVWGLGDWSPVPESLRPSGTVIENGLMQTPMEQVGSTFKAQVRVAAGEKVVYGFQTRRRKDGLAIRSVWDGGDQYALVAGHDTTLLIPAAATYPSADSKSVWPWLIGLLVLFILTGVYRLRSTTNTRAALSRPRT